MSIDKIKQLMPIPKSPHETPEHDWTPVFTKLDVPGLPTDYKEFISTYGTGAIGDFLWIMNPFSKNPSLNMEMMLAFRKAYDAMKEDFPIDFPRESSSFLPWAMTDDGDAVAWLLGNEDPNLWPVIIQGRQVWKEERTNLTTSEFLEALLENNLETSVFPQEFIKGRKKFKPF